MSCGTRVSFTEEPHFRLRGCHPLWPAIQCRSASSALSYSAEEMPLFARIPRPLLSNASTLALSRFRLIPVRSPLLGESLFDFFSSRYLDVSVPWVGRRRLCIHRMLVGIPYAGCPIRRSPDHNLLAVPRSFSQLSTSFIASDRLGIHRAPFVA